MFWIKCALLQRPAVGSGTSAMRLPRAYAKAAIFALLILTGFPAFSQVDRSAYRDSTIEEIVATLRLPVGVTESTEEVSVLLPPEFKYRLRVNATGNIRQLTPDTAAALSVWGRTESGLPAFLKEYTHEVEVIANDKPVWLIWQRSLVAPFRAERSSGSAMDIYAICAGTFQGRLMLLITAFESLG